MTLTDSIPNFVFMYLVGAALAFFIVRTCVSSFCKRAFKRHAMARRTRETVVTIVGVALGLPIAFVAVNMATYNVSAGSGEEQQATVGEVAQSFGLTTGKSYPLVLGNRIAGSSGLVDVTAGLFSFSASASIAPATATTISFAYEDTSYMLELPTSRITFIQSEVAEPSVTLRLKHRNDLFSSYSGGGQGVGSGDTLVVRTFGQCRPIWVDLTLRCEREALTTDITIGKSIRHDGLGPVVGEHFRNAEITLTPQQYKQLLGG